MMRGAALSLLISVSAPMAIACDLGSITARLEEPLEIFSKIERDVSDVQSTEGGVWQIYREKDGRIHSIIRIDGGESGRNETRFSAVSRKDYGIAVTRLDYIRHAFVDTDTPFAVTRKTTNYYFFCDGKLYQPKPDSSMLPESYGRDGNAARAVFLEAREIAEFTPGFLR